MTPTKKKNFCDSVKTAKTEVLLNTLKSSLQLSADGLFRAAVVWVELEKRGVDLSGYKTPLLAHLPAIASGQLMPEILVRYGYHNEFVEAAAQLVLEDQQKLLSDNPVVPVLVTAPDGSKYETRELKPTELRVSQIKQVFGDGRIRTPSEQKKFAPTLKPKVVEKAEEADFDVEGLLTPKQRRQLIALAESKEMTPAEFIVDVLVRNKIVTEHKSTRRAADLPESRASA